jgi:hypothetical protein
LGLLYGVIFMSQSAEVFWLLRNMDEEGVARVVTLSGGGGGSGICIAKKLFQMG